MSTETKNAEAGSEPPYYGNDCPVGMVQVEFVGCSPTARVSDYGWKPVKSAFLEVWVDGKRFRIDVGDFNGRRGIHVSFPFACAVDQHSVNALDIYFSAPSDD